MVEGAPTGEMSGETRDEASRPPAAVKRCGTCARFVRVFESTNAQGETVRAGECLLGVWSPPLYENNTCSQHLQRGMVATTLAKGKTSRARPTSRRTDATSIAGKRSVEIPEELLSMNADEFRDVLRQVIRDELGVGEVDLGARWAGGQLILKPGKEGTADKAVPIETFFHKIVMVRDKLRVLEQRINAHAVLSDEEKLQMQQYITQCYGSLTTFNVLFAEKNDYFSGQRGDGE